VLASSEVLLVLVDGLLEGDTAKKLWIDRGLAIGNGNIVIRWIDDILSGKKSDDLIVFLVGKFLTIDVLGS